MAVNTRPAAFRPGGGAGGSGGGGSLGDPVTVAHGGTGLATLTSGSLLTGAGTSNVTFTALPLTVANGGTGVGTLTGVLKGNGTSAVTAAAQLAVADGGTGAATLTGVLKGNGTSAITAAAQLAVADGGTGAGTLTGILKGNGTSAFTAVTAPSGAIVGDTDTQTLTNKTIVPVVASALTDASTTTWNADNGSKFTLLATSGVGNTRALGDPSGTVRDGRAYQLRYTQDGTGGRALTVSGTGVKIATALGGGTTVPLDTSASAINLITMIADSTTLYIVSVARLA